MAELVQHEGHGNNTESTMARASAQAPVCWWNSDWGEMPSPGGATSVCLCRDDSTGEMEDQHPSGLH